MSRTALRRLALALLGLLAPLALLIAWAPPWRMELDGWDNFYLETYPWNFRSTPKHLVIATGCWTWTTWAYMPIGSHEAVTTQRATFHSALNVMLAERGGEAAAAERFFAFGRPELDFGRHLLSVYQAVRQGEVRSLIYINNPGSLQAFTRPAVAVTELAVLDAIERDYPRLANDVRTYRAALLASRGFQKGLTEREQSPWWPATRHRVESWATGLANRWSGIRDSLALTPARELRDRAEIDDLFEKVKANYDNPVTCNIGGRGLMDPKEYWIGAGGEATWQAWLRIAAGMAAEHGIPFIYYVPPHLNVPQERYESEFKPHFVDRVRAVLADIPGARVIDHAVGRDYSACDQVYDTDRKFAAGYLLNFAGKLKQARLLLAEMAAQQLVPAEPAAFAAPSRWEASLPALPYKPRVLSAAESEAVREELIKYREWELSLPVR